MKKHGGSELDADNANRRQLYLARVKKDLDVCGDTASSYGSSGFDQSRK